MRPVIVFEYIYKAGTYITSVGGGYVKNLLGMERCKNCNRISLSFTY